MSLGTWLPTFLGLFAMTYAHTWDYSTLGPEKWASQYPDCGGQRQSPINLRSADAQHLNMQRINSEGIYIDLYNYDKYSSGTIVNNGHSVSLDLTYPNKATAPHVDIEGPIHSGNYVLEGAHFHWPSEHRLEGRGFPLELHMLHTDAATGKQLVISFLYETCANDGYNEAPSGLSKVAKMAASSQRDVGVKSKVTGFQPQSIMSDMGYLSYGKQNGCDFYAYEGSLTTPPCTENVNWLVHKQPLCIFESQLESFYSVHTANHTVMAGNTRPTQPLNNRQILHFVC